jgi:hypothetical protein
MGKFRHAIFTITRGDVNPEGARILPCSLPAIKGRAWRPCFSPIQSCLNVCDLPIMPCHDKETRVGPYVGLPIESS